MNVSARFNAAGVCTEVVCVGQDVTATNAARGRQAELEQQMDAVSVSLRVSLRVSLSVSLSIH